MQGKNNDLDNYQQEHSSPTKNHHSCTLLSNAMLSMMQHACTPFCLETSHPPALHGAPCAALFPHNAQISRPLNPNSQPTYREPTWGANPQHARTEDNSPVCLRRACTNVPYIKERELRSNQQSNAMQNHSSPQKATNSTQQMLVGPIAQILSNGPTPPCAANHQASCAVRNQMV